MFKSYSRLGLVGIGVILGATLISCGDNPKADPAAVSNSGAEPQANTPVETVKTADHSTAISELKPGSKISFVNPVELPKKSNVILASANANTSVEYEKKWFRGQRCECKIEAYAFAKQFNKPMLNLPMESLVLSDKPIITQEETMKDGSKIRYSVLEMNSLKITDGAKSTNVAVRIHCRHKPSSIEQITVEDMVEAFGGASSVAVNASVQP